MNKHLRDRLPSAATIYKQFGISSLIERPLDVRLDSFVGDQYLFVEMLRAEVLRDAKSSSAAIMLRVSRAINNSTLGQIFDHELPMLADAAPVGKRRADLVEALLGALVREGEFENASRLLQGFYLRNRVPANLRFPERAIERTDCSLGVFSLLGAEAVGLLESRLLVAALVPEVRELHPTAQLVRNMLQRVWRGPKKSPSECCLSVVAGLSKHGVQAALDALEAGLSASDSLELVTLPPGFERTWGEIRKLIALRARSPSGRNKI